MPAFVDESMRSGPAGLYVVASVVVAEDLDRVREEVRGVLRPGQPRFHWRVESEKQRFLMLDVLADLHARAYACAPVSRNRTERARALCLRSMLWDLTYRDGPLVDELVVESRQEHNDRQDRRVIGGEQRARRAPPSLRFRHEHPGTEPLLWLADAAAGAVSAARAGETTRYVDAIGGRLTITELSL